MEFRGRRDASREKEDGAIPMRKVYLIFVLLRVVGVIIF